MYLFRSLLFLVVSSISFNSHIFLASSITYYEIGTDDIHYIAPGLEEWMSCYEKFYEEHGSQTKILCGCFKPGWCLRERTKISITFSDDIIDGFNIWLQEQRAGKKKRVPFSFEYKKFIKEDGTKGIEYRRIFK